MLRQILADLMEVRAIIALVLVLAFVAAVFTGHADHDLTNVVLIVIGFYFMAKTLAGNVPLPDAPPAISPPTPPAAVPPSG